MPRKVDPGSIRVGKGLAPEGTVEDNSFRYPERDVDPLRVHIHDPSRAHMASSIGIVDASDCFVSDEVEGALQELCSGSGAGRLNGLISGGTFNELGNAPNGSSSVATAVLTLETTTEILIKAAVFDASALTVSIPAVADDYYIYLDTNSGSADFQTLVAATTVPEVESAAGVEHVLLAKITYDGANVTAWQDGRFFVRNLDRKVQYSSRQGENVDAWSEGCFATLQAFFLWMSEYGEGTGTPSEEEKGTVIVRGEHTITSPLVVPTDYLQFIGDGNAIIKTGAGFSGNAMLDITGRSGITFRNLRLQATGGGTPDGIYAATSQALARIRIENCFLDAGTFVNGINLSTPSFSGFDIIISGCTVIGNTTSIRLDGLKDVTIKGCRVFGAGTGAAGTAIRIGESVGCEEITISDCHVESATTGLLVEDTKIFRVVGCSVSEITTGIFLRDSVSSFVVSNNIVDGFLPGTASIEATSVGIRVLAVTGGAPTDGIIQGNEVRRVGSRGISLEGVAIAGPLFIRILDVTVVNNLVDQIVRGQDNRTDSYTGIGTVGIGLNLCRNCDVLGNTVTSIGAALNNAGTPITIAGNIWPVPVYFRNSDNIKASDNTIHGPISAGIGFAQGFYVNGGGLGVPTTISEILITENRVRHTDTNALPQAYCRFDGSDATNLVTYSNISVEGNNFTKEGSNPNQGIAFVADTVVGTNGIGGAVLNIRVAGNIISGFEGDGVFIQMGEAGSGVHVPVVDNIQIKENTIAGSANPVVLNQSGVAVLADTTTVAVGAVLLRDVVVDDNNIRAWQTGVRVRADAATGATGRFESVSVSGNEIPYLYGAANSTAIVVDRDGTFSAANRQAVVVSDNNIGGASESTSGHVGIGIRVSIGAGVFYDLKVSDNLVICSNTGLVVSGTEGGPGESISNVHISDNVFAMTRSGVVYGAAGIDKVWVNLDQYSLVDLTVTNNQIDTHSGTAAGAEARGLRIDLDNDTNTAFLMSGALISGNKISGGNLLLDLESIEIDDVMITDNNIQASSLNGCGEGLEVSVVRTGVSADPNVEGLVIRGNSVHRSQGVQVTLDGCDVIKNLAVDSNTVHETRPNTVGTASGNAVGVTVLGDDIELTNISVNGNHISDIAGGNVRAVYFRLTPDSIRLGNLSVSENMVYGPIGGNSGYAIQLGIDSVTTSPTSHISRVVVDNNIITGDQNPFEYHNLGIAVDGPTPTTGPAFRIEGWSVSGNKVTVAGADGETVIGLSLKLQDLDAAPFRAQNISVDRNDITVITTHTDTYPECSGLLVEMTCGVVGLSVSENSVVELPTGSSLRYNDYGIRLFHSFTEAESERNQSAGAGGFRLVGQNNLSGNLLYNHSGAGDQSFAAVSWENVRISNNNIQFSAGDANSYVTGQAALSIESQVNNVGGDNLISVCLWGLVVSGNSVRSGKSIFDVSNNGYFSVNTASQLNLTGFYVCAYPYDTQFRGAASTLSNADTVNHGWAITGNNVSDFCREDGSGGSLHGFDVRVNRRDTSPTGIADVWRILVDGNYAQDLTHDSGNAKFGFDRFDLQPIAATTNITGNPRIFP